MIWEIRQLIAAMAASHQAPAPPVAVPPAAAHENDGEYLDIGNPNYKYSRVEFPKFNGNDLEG